ncbi:5-carboxymethyl-2-hydroxymuconate Delta-isomerase [Streptomyces sp. NPDC088354]|uniref:5-carboxymethyl-2-hydroxymuconate Delta-isomerase n=1 Tax=Streptomyces sp. NPDC088354 TaxID=3365856 RepID=UPI00380400C7
MPHITVDYSAELADAFDRRAFALALHPLIAKIVDTKAEACKTRFRRVEEAVIADGGAEHAMVYAQIAVMAGRSPQVKAELSEAVLELVAAHLAPTPRLRVQSAVDISELDPAWYRKHIEPAKGA